MSIRVSISIASLPEEIGARYRTQTSHCVNRLTGDFLPQDLRTVAPELVRPEDVVVAADVIGEVLYPVSDLDWSVRAGSLDWDVTTTVAHMAGAVAKYALCLSSATTRFIALRLMRYPGATNDDLVAAVTSTARSLAAAAANAPATTRAYHSSGMADAEGFVAMGCVELLVHAGDIAAGLTVELHPPDDLCERVLQRLFPWVTHAAPPWERLLWATGRIALPEAAGLDESWRWHAAPLDEWDGAMPERQADPPTSYRYDTKTGRWEPHWSTN
jgi:uncharacterized protein (TIGR03083 family)